MRVLLCAPLPPPRGGIATWTRTVIEQGQGDASIDLDHFDTAVRWRTFTNRSDLTRIIGGSFQGLIQSLQVLVWTQRTDYDVVHICSSGSFGFLRDYLYLSLLSISSCEVILHYHMGVLPAVLERSSFLSWIAKRVIEKADGVIVLDLQSRLALQRKTKQSRVFQLPNGIGLKTDVQPLPADGSTEIAEPLNFIYVGHLIKSKGLLDLVQAAKSISTKDGVKYTLVGKIDASFKDDLVKAISEDESLNFEVIGEVPHEEVLMKIRAAHFFILPSHHEGFPMSVLEAMASETPIISTAVGAVPEMLDANTENPCGWICEPRNSNDLRRVMDLAIENRKLSQEYAKRAKQKLLEKYTIRAVFSELKTIWRRFLEV